MVWSGGIFLASIFRLSFVSLWSSNELVEAVVDVVDILFIKRGSFLVNDVNECARRRGASAIATRSTKTQKKKPKKKPKPKKNKRKTAPLSLGSTTRTVGGYLVFFYWVSMGGYWVEKKSKQTGLPAIAMAC